MFEVIFVKQTKSTKLYCLMYQNHTVFHVENVSCKGDDFLYFIFPVVAGALKNSFHNMADMAFKPVVLCGPSGSGKSTLVKKLMEEFQGCFAFTISRNSFI